MRGKNLWTSDLVAVAYSYQQKAKPYLELLETTEGFMNTKPGQRWLDLGCGSGRLIESILRKSEGNVEQIIGVDISRRGMRIAKESLERLGGNLVCSKVQFVQADFSHGLNCLRPNSFDGITAGLCVSYADHWDPVKQKWDQQAYAGLMKDIFAILKAHGTLILSSNVPDPNFTRIALRSWKQILLTWKAPLNIAVSLVMLFQSRWLKRCAAAGRFHYLAASEVLEHLQRVGFRSVTYELSYAGQAWVFLAVKGTE
jgi:ubiquinone/menaquinone biosynthesis C-methylase UbiE